MSRRLLLALGLAGALGAGGCSPLLKLGAGPPHASAHAARLQRGPDGALAGVAIDVDLYNPNPIPLAAMRFDYRLAAGDAIIDGSTAARGALPAHQHRLVRLIVPLADAPAVIAAIEAGTPFELSGALVLDGAVSGLAVGVAGEGVLADAGGSVRIAFGGRLAGGVQ